MQEIFASHPDYAQYGQPDTSNASDNVVGNAKLATYVCTTERMSDGAMLASKELVVFAARAAELASRCSAARTTADACCTGT